MSKNSLLKYIHDVQAVIFDMDGVIADTEPLKAAAYQKVFTKEFNVTLPESDYSWRGQPEECVMAYWLKMFDIQADVHRLIGLKRMAYQELLQREQLTLIPGITDFVKFLKQLNKKLGVATGSNKSEQQQVLAMSSLENMFDHVLVRCDVASSKPDPDIYLMMAKRLDVSPQCCLVFEDSPAGVMAAQKAGMPVVGVLTSYMADELKACQFYIHNFKDIPLNV